MMKKLLFALLSIVPMSSFAQLFAPPMPLMYRPMLQLEAPGQKVKAIVTARYIPGSRFPDSWDQKNEERQYDPAGRLTVWKRYDGYTGAILVEKKISYNAQGDRTEERTFRKETNKEEVLKFQNSYDGKGAFLSSVITDGTGKQVGSVKVLPDGNRVTELALGPGGKRLITVHDNQGRMLRSQDEVAQTAESYAYDNFGELTSIEKTRAGKTSLIQYKSIRDKENRIIQQEEISPEGKRVMQFEYDKQGNLITRKWDAVRVAETYGYAPGGQITDIMQYSVEGHPREVTAVFTERYR